MKYLKEILTSAAVTIIIGLLTWIAISVRDVPQLKEDNKTQHDRYDELIQQILDKQQADRERIITLEVKQKIKD